MNVFEIFVAAIAIDDPAQRAAYLDQTCGGDLTLRRRVDELLAAHEESGEFLHVAALQQMAGDRSRQDHASASDEPLDLSFLTPSENPAALGRLMHYEVLELVGRGGCGIVFRAFDEKLRRVVAVKIMAPETAAGSPARKRFVREAHATAAIHHENVVSIYAVEERPLPFLVMEFIDGQTLQDRILQTGPLDPREVATIGAQIARGLEAAHARGVIHRDVKPANILIQSGSSRPKLTDFGLARTMDDASLTRSGVIAGTPLYMSPEQAEGQTVDHRSDLFSFGSVLYVMCSGRPPFRAASTRAVLNRVVEDTPRPIAEIMPDVPEWLVAIISRLHAKQPEDRLDSARRAAELLERGQHPGPIPPREPPTAPPNDPNEPPTPVGGPLTPIVRLMRRFAQLSLATKLQLAALSVALAVAALWATGGPSPESNDRTHLSLSEPTHEASSATPVAVGTAASSAERVPAVPAETVSTAETTSAALGPAAKLRPAGTGPATGAEFSVLVFDEAREPTRAVAFTPDEGRVLAASNGDHHEIHGNVRYHVAGRDNCVRVWNLQSGETEHRFPMSEGQHYGPLGLSISPDGALVAVASGWETANGPSEPRVYVFDVTTGERTHHFAPEGNHAMRAAAFSPTGTLSAVRSGQGGIQTWQMPSGAPSPDVTLQGIPRAEAPRLNWSPDGAFILGGEWTNGTRLFCWDRVTGEIAGEFRGHSSRPSDAEMSRDGTLVVSCADDNTVRLWDRRTAQQKHRIYYPRVHVRCVAISPNGELFASGGNDGVLQLYESETGRLIARQAAHVGGVFDVAFSFSGNLFASVGDDRTVQIHRVERKMQEKAE